MPAMRRDGFSPPQLFLSFALVAAGAVLVAERPGSRALLILDWPRLFLVAGAAIALLFLGERLLSRRVRRESRAYPYAFAILVGLLGASVTLACAVNCSFAREPDRVLHPPVRSWVSAWQASGGEPGHHPRNEGRFEAMYADVESWRDPGQVIRIPVSIEAQEAAQGPGPHVLEVVAPTGLLGIEYVQQVRLVTP